MNTSAKVRRKPFQGKSIMAKKPKKGKETPAEDSLSIEGETPVTPEAAAQGPDRAADVLPRGNEGRRPVLEADELEPQHEERGDAAQGMGRRGLTLQGDALRPVED